MARSTRVHTNITTFLFITSIIVCPCLAITVFPSNTEPRAYDHHSLPKASLDPQDLFRRSCPNEFATYKNATVLFSSNSGLLEDGDVYPTSDSFVRGTIDAWSQHQHLVIRPDEVWFSILAQMNFYMNKNAESLRHLFVDHKGKEEIVVWDNSWEDVLYRFQDEIQARVKTPWLRDWIIPDFTTTTRTDVVTANILMMGLMKSYFDYFGGIICGLPSVTLLGEQSDWKALLGKLDHLADFGTEPRAYSKQLRPILSRFVQTFDKPDDPAIRDFWKSVVNAEGPSNLCGAPPYRFSGWLMGFIFWDAEGGPLGALRGKEFVMDGISYPSRGMDELPVSYAGAPFTMLDYPDPGTPKFQAYVVAGNLGKRIREGLPDGYAEALSRFNSTEVDFDLPHGALQPLSGWMLYGPAPHSQSLVESPAGSEEWNFFQIWDNPRLDYA